MNIADIRDLYAYDVWATNLVVEAVTPLTEEQYRRDLGSSHGGVHGTLTHLHGADRIWLDRMLGSAQPRITSPEEVPDLADMRRRIAEYQNDMNGFIVKLSDEKLQEKFSYTDIRGNPWTTVLWHAMVHKVNHASYHRGQIITMLRQLGAKPVTTDMIAWFRKNR